MNWHPSGWWQFLLQEKDDWYVQKIGEGRGERTKGASSLSAQWMVQSNMEKAMAPHPSTLAWKIPWVEEPSRPQSMGSPRIGHDWVTSLSLFSVTISFWNFQVPELPKTSFIKGIQDNSRKIYYCLLNANSEFGMIVNAYILYLTQSCLWGVYYFSHCLLMFIDVQWDEVASLSSCGL